MKLLVPFDQSTRDRLLLPRCVDLARRTNATILAVHVVPSTKALFRNAAREAQAYLETVADALRAQGVETAPLVRKGDAATEIARLAEEYEVDIIAMITRGRRGWDKMVLGSVAEALIAKCPVPVLLVNEATVQSAQEARLTRQSQYLASVIWRKRARGALSDEEAVGELERMAHEGLDRPTLYATYEALQKEGANAEWLDLDFQLRTLQRFLPEDLAEVRERVRYDGTAA
jgi:nucleotide-binding universal stress UspA family protein